MLTEILKKVLPLIINIAQVAFVEGCQMLDAILVASKAVGALEKGEEERIFFG